MGVGEGALQMCSGLALRVVHKYEAVLLIKTELVGPAPGVVGAAVRAPRGRGSAGGGPRPVAGAAGLAGRLLRVLADARLLRFGIRAVFILGLLPWESTRERETADASVSLTLGLALFPSGGRKAQSQLAGHSEPSISSKVTHSNEV